MHNRCGRGSRRPWRCGCRRPHGRSPQWAVVASVRSSGPRPHAGVTRLLQAVRVWLRVRRYPDQRHRSGGVASETAGRPVRKGSGPAPGIADTTRYHMAMAMTLRLSDEQTEALRRKAEAEHRSMQQVALAAIDAYVHQATPARRQSVPVTELMTVFQDLPPMSVEAFRADQDRYADAEAYFDAYERIHEPEDGE